MTYKSALLAIFLFLSFLVPLKSQNISISMRLLNAENNLPVSGAHLFIENTTFGTFSDDKGVATFEIPNGTSGELIISHLGFNAVSILPAKFKDLKNEYVFHLNKSSFELPEFVITAQRDKKWNKRFKRFRQGFLGKDEISKKCKIINPEVLSMEDDGNTLRVVAKDLIHITNSYLGYEIYYLLNNFEITKDGSVKYQGRARFIDSSTSANAEQIEKNRQYIHLNSSKHFFKSLIDDKVEENGYVVEIVDYIGGSFKKIKDFDRSMHFEGPSQSNRYTVDFTEFLQVYNLNTKKLEVRDEGLRIGGLESQRFSSTIQDKKEIVKYKQSQLYKIAPYIILNEHGNILNTHHVKEYGYWADQKVAHQLPFNFGNIYSETKSKNDITSTQAIDVYQWLYQLLYGEDARRKNDILAAMSANWNDRYTAPLLELLRMSNDRILVEHIINLLQEKYQQTESDYYSWSQWLWKQNFPQEDYYFKFKSELYKNIDPVFYRYFKDRKLQSKIRLDEVLWGGVEQDGIPPLRHPQHLRAKEATYLNEDDVVFGVFINGIARAYPKRILAWHEFFTDNFNGPEIAGVYCTLCGTVIAYDMHHNNTFHDLGTSGFLYGSNKLMYDHATQSLWSTIDGIPVIGPLVDKGIRLKTYPVITTTWKAWLEQHPETEVLSLDTGYKRDYSEGAAYKDYFATDQLMFPVKNIDKRLNNKDEVFIVRTKDYQNDPLAISIKYLKRKKWHQDTINETNIIVIADPAGAARAYNTGLIQFKSLRKNKLTDQYNQTWEIQENQIVSDSGHILKRLPAHNIFWFAWYNAYPNTRLVK